MVVTCAASGKTTTYTGSGNTTFDLTPGSGIFQAAQSMKLTTDATFARFLVEPGKTIVFDNTATYTVTNYVAGDWDGTAGNLVTFESNSAGNQFDLINPVGMSVNYMAIKDSKASNYIDAFLDQGNVDNGNNSPEWRFYRSGLGSMQERGQEIGQEVGNNQ
jgi:hypothetical protein